MSLVRPMKKSMITRTKPIAPARSITLNGTGLPRTFSTRLQKMWPPSSGRNGKRLIRPRERLTTASRISASVAPNSSIVWLATSLTPTTPETCLRCSESSRLAKTVSVLRRDQPHEAGGAVDRPADAEVGGLGAVGEADQGAVRPPRRTPGGRGSCSTSPSRSTRSVTGVAARQPSTCLPAHLCVATSSAKRVEPGLAVERRGSCCPSTARIVSPGCSAAAAGESGHDSPDRLGDVAGVERDRRRGSRRRGRC